MVRKPKEDSAVATLDPPAIPTYSEIIRKRIRADVTSYRSLVSRAASGEQLSESELIEAYETLGRIGYPPGQFEADLSAIRDHAKYKARWAEYLAKEPEERERARAVDREIDELKKQLDTLKAEAHRLSFGSGLKAAANLQRCNELATAHNHVLAEDVDQVVEMRARALRVDAVGVKV
jgi:hypothetical protein